MRQHWLRWMGIGGASAVVGFVLVSGLSVLAQGAATEVEIIRDPTSNRFVFKEKNVTIKKGQEIKWVIKAEGRQKHKLMPVDPKKDAGFKETIEFGLQFPGMPESAMQKFDEVTTAALNYRCAFHDSMEGTVTVDK